MAKKIVDETLKFSIVINGDQAQKEYGNLNRANKKLEQERIDLESQAKKLKKTEGELSDAYKNAVADLDKNTQAIAENEKKMHALTEEIGINKLTQIQLGQVSKNLTTQIRGLSKELNPEDWQRLTNELQKVKARQSELAKEMQATSASMSDQIGVLDKFTAGFMQVFDGLKSGNYKEAAAGFQSIGGGIQAATKASLAFIATPIGATLAVLAGIGFIVKQWFDYNDAIKESVVLTEQITKLQGEQADAIRLRNQALKETFGTDEQENLETAAALVTKFKISYEEAFDVIEDGLIKGQKNNKEYFESLSEYAVFFDSLGYSAKEFQDIIAAGYDLKIYSDKLPDALKEFDISIREQTKATREALINAYGQTFTDDLLSRIKSGTTTTKEALNEIATESKRIGLNIEQNQRLTADVFRGAGEDVGGAVKIFEALDLAATNANRPLTDLEKSTKELTDSTLELAKAQDEALKSDNYVALTRDLQLFWTKTKQLFFEGVKFITDSFTSVTDFVVSSVVSVIITFQKLPEIIQTGFGNIKNAVFDTIKSVSGLGDVFDRLVRLDFSGAKKAATDFKNNFTTNFNGIKQSATDTVKEILATQKVAQQLAQETINNRRIGNASAVNQSSSTDPNINPNNGNNFELGEANKQAGEAAAKEQEKAVADALRKKQAVQDAIDKFDEEQAIRDQLKQVEKDQRAEEEAVIRKELEFVKLTEEAAGDTQLLAQIENAKLNEIQAIRDGFAEQRAAKEEAERNRLLAIEKNYKQQSIDAETNFQNAKRNLLNGGLNILTGVFKQETAIGKAAFLFQKGKAIADIIQSTSLANAKIASSLAVANSLAVAASPLTFGAPWVAINSANAAKNTAASNINAAIQIATIAASSLQGFEKGLYPVTRAQDGKRYNAGINGSGTQIANSPTILVGERPELIVDPDTYKRMDPQIRDYILRLAGKPVPGYENGSYPATTQQQTTPQPTTNDPIMLTLAAAINNLVEKGIIAKTYYGIEDELQRKEIEDKLTATKKASQN